MSRNESPPLTSDPTEKDFVERSEIALQKIRDVVTGNFFHPLEDVELVSYEEVFLEFEAQSCFKSHQERGERLVGKAPPGLKKVKGPTELDSLVGKEIENVITQEATLTDLKEQVLRREDKGFFLNNERFPLAAQPLGYLREEPCNHCRGQKFVECFDCKGHGHIRCRQCNAQNSKNCSLCKGRGEIQCQKCQTKGKRECQNCQGFGTINRVTMVKLFADSSFSYDKENVPAVAIGIIERLREKLIVKGHAMYAVSDDIDAAEKKNAESIMTLTYDVKLPLGDAVFRVGEETVPALLFGYKCALLDVPPFLERYMLGPFNLLREAAKGEGNIAAKIRSAAFQTRLTNQAVLGVATKGPQRAEADLRNEYSIALEPQFIHNLIKVSRIALNKLTVKPQMLGLAVGLVPAFLLILLYIFVFGAGGANTALPLRFILDFVVLCSAIYLPYLGAQIMTRQSLIYALGNRVKNLIRLPKLGIRGLWGPLLAVLFFIYFASIAHQNNPQSAPQSYTHIYNFLMNTAP